MIGNVHGAMLRFPMLLFSGRKISCVSGGDYHGVMTLTWQVREINLGRHFQKLSVISEQLGGLMEGYQRLRFRCSILPWKVVSIADERYQLPCKYVIGTVTVQSATLSI